MLGGDLAVGEIVDPGDPGVDRVEGAQESAEVDVVRAQVAADGAEHPDAVLDQRPLDAEAPENGLVEVAVAVDEAGEDDVVAHVDHLGAGDVPQVADGGDDVPLDEDVAAEVAECGVDGDDGPAAEHGSGGLGWHCCLLLASRYLKVRLGTGGLAS